MAKQSKPALPKKQKPTGETASELSHRHLTDKNHQTTDEEIRNINLELDTPGNVVDSKGKRTGDDEDDIITTPLSVLGE